MHTFIQRGERFTWNNQFEEAEEMLKPYVKTNARCAHAFSSIMNAKSGMSGSVAHRNETIVLLSQAHDVIKSLNSDDKVRAYIKETLELNAKAKELNEQDIKDGKLPDIMHEKTKSLLEFKEQHVKLPRLETPVEEWTDKQLLDNYKMDLRIATSEITLWRGITQLQNASPLKGAYNLRKAWKGFQSLLKELESEAEKHNKGQANAILYHKDVHEMVLVGVGIFYYLLSVLPATITKVLEFIGFKSEREVGIEYLEHVACERGPRSITAILMLSINYLFIPSALEDKTVALSQFKPHMDYAVQVYPQGGMMMFLANQYARKTGDYPKGIEHLQEAIDSMKKYDFAPTMYICELAHGYFCMQDYQKAMENYEPLLEVKDAFEAQSFSALSLAICYYKLGKLDKYQETMKRVHSFCKAKNQLDLYVLDKLKVLDTAKNENERNCMVQIAGYELMYLKRDIAHLSQEAIANVLIEFDELFQQVTTTVKSPDAIAAVHLIRGAMLKTLEKNEEAAQHFDKVIAMAKEIKYEKQWPASAGYERGEIEYFAGNLQAAEELMKKADTFGKYGFEHVLKSRLKLALKKIHSDMKKK